MKKLAAILLIFLLAFNWYGYRLVTDLLTRQSDQQLESQLDNNEYDESQLIEIRVALNVPYQNVETGFERHYGEVEVNGVFYTYVKSKVQNGSLVLQCIPNATKQQIRKAGNDFYKMTNGLDQEQSGKKANNTSVAKQSIGDFDDQLESFTVAAPVAMTTLHYIPRSAFLPEVTGRISIQPPRLS